MTGIYSRPSYQSGYPVFVGGRRQVGGGIFGALRRMVLPTLKKYGVPIMKRVGSRALDFGANVAADALQGEDIGESMKMRAQQSAIDALDDLTKTRRTVRKKRRKSRQVGSGRVTKQRRRKSKKPTRAARSKSRRRVKTRKRKRNSTATRNKSKRRKTTYL